MSITFRGPSHNPIWYGKTNIQHDFFSTTTPQPTTILNREIQYNIFLNLVFDKRKYLKTITSIFFWYSKVVSNVHYVFILYWIMRFIHYSSTMHFASKLKSLSIHYLENKSLHFTSLIIMDNLQHYMDLSIHGTDASLCHNSMIYMFIASRA